jgi:hypothetical protein
VTLHFELDDDGIARLSRAEAVLEEEPSKTALPEPTPEASGSKAASGSASTSGSASASASASSSASATAPPASDEATSTGAADASTAASASASATPEPTPVKPLRRLLRYPLTVTLDAEAPSLMVTPLGAADKTAAHAALRKLAKADEEKR